VADSALLLSITAVSPELVADMHVSKEYKEWDGGKVCGQLQHDQVRFGIRQVALHTVVSYFSIVSSVGRAQSMGWRPKSQAAGK
jgi:hypothetical protein